MAGARRLPVARADVPEPTWNRILDVVVTDQHLFLMFGARGRGDRSAPRVCERDDAQRFAEFVSGKSEANKSEAKLALKPN
jgi:hypothetical protein